MFSELRVWMLGIVVVFPAVQTALAGWTHIYGDSLEDVGYFVQQTSDEGYIIVGYWSSGIRGIGSDLFLIKTNSSGDTMWTRKYGKDFGGTIEYGSCVRQTSDGGYIITGRVGSEVTNSYDMWLLKTDENGDTLWSKTYGSVDGNTIEIGRCVCNTRDGGYIIVGETDYPEMFSCWLLKTDGNGDTLWTRSFKEGMYTRGVSVRQTNDGGYVIGGTVLPRYEKYDVWISKTDAEGNSLWSKRYGGLSGDVGGRLEVTGDGGYIILALTYSYGEGGDIWLIKTDARGDTLAVSEYPHATETSNWEVTSTVGRHVVLNYSDCPNGFHAVIFDACGRKVDELYGAGSSGSITWGEGYCPGVYFIQSVERGTSGVQKAILIR